MSEDEAGDDLENLAILSTEERRDGLADLDRLPAEDVARLMATDTAAVAAALERAATSIGNAAEAIGEWLEHGQGRLIHIGAGTAGRMGLLDAAECGPTFNTDRVLGVMAGGTDATATADEPAEDDAGAAVADLSEIHLGPDDAVVGISASGRTPYTLAAIRQASRVGALTVGVSSNADTALSRAVQFPIEILTGPELIAGSTRLKAGTAQKVVCNTLSTWVMGHLGATYGDLMVDVRATNAKLRDRSVRIVSAATGADQPTAARMLDTTDGRVKVAIVALADGVQPVVATERLRAVGGRVRGALEDLE